jgi:hypothetical protein
MLNSGPIVWPPPPGRRGSLGAVSVKLATSLGEIARLSVTCPPVVYIVNHRR